MNNALFSGRRHDVTRFRQKCYVMFGHKIIYDMMLSIDFNTTLLFSPLNLLGTTLCANKRKFTVNDGRAKECSFVTSHVKHLRPSKLSPSEIVA